MNDGVCTPVRMETYTDALLFGPEGERMRVQIVLRAWVNPDETVDWAVHRSDDPTIGFGEDGVSGDVAASIRGYMRQVAAMFTKTASRVAAGALLCVLW